LTALAPWAGQNASRPLTPPGSAALEDMTSPFASSA